MVDNQLPTHAPLLRWQAVAAAIGALLVVGLLLQSAGSYSTVLVAASGGTYVEGMVGGPRYLNPLLSQFNEVDSDIASLVFAGLVRQDECGKILPDLAESWQVSADGRQYSFTLRKDALWHDGVPVVAEDVAYTIGVVQSADYQGPPVIARLWRDVEVTVADERTVVFELPESYGPFLSYADIGLLPSHILSGQPVATLAQAEFNRLPIGAGPFYVAASDGARVLLRPSPAYYGERPYLEAIEFRFFRGLGEALRAHERGEVQGIADVTTDYLPEIGADAGLNVYSGPLSRVAMVLINLKGAGATFLGEEDVRRALMFGLDRQALVANVLDGRGLVAHAPFAPCSWALDANGPTYAFDPVRARELLEGVGWHDGDGDGVRERDGERLAFELVAQDERGSLAVAQELARQWLLVGVEARVVALPFGEMVDDRLQPREFDAALVELSLEGDPDPYVLWHSSQAQPGGQNYSAFVDQEADGLLEAARREWDVDKRRPMYNRFQQIFVEELPALPLFYPVYSYAVDQGVRGVQIGPMTASRDRFRGIAAWYLSFRRVRLRRADVGEQP